MPLHGPESRDGGEVTNELLDGNGLRDSPNDHDRALGMAHDPGGVRADQVVAELGTMGADEYDAGIDLLGDREDLGVDRAFGDNVL